MNTKSWLLRQFPFTRAVSYLVNTYTNPNMVYAGNLTITEKFRFSIKLLNKYGLICSQTLTIIIPNFDQKITIFVWDLYMEKKELKSREIGADELGERPIEGGAAANGGVRVSFQRRLVHCHHDLRRIAVSVSLRHFSLDLSLYTELGVLKRVRVLIREIVEVLGLFGGDKNRISPVLPKL